MLVKIPAHSVLFFGLCLLAGAPAHAECTLIKITEMPLIKLGNHTAVMVKIVDEERPIIVDTGAATSMISMNVAEELELPQDQVREQRIIGIGQTNAESYPNVIVSSLGLGNLVFLNRSVPQGRIDFGDVPERESIGLLGDDILSLFDVEFDFIDQKLTFYHASGCYDTFIPWTGGYSATPFQHDNTKIVLDVILNGERNTAILDTGNPTSMVSGRLLTRWKIPASALSKPIGKAGSPLNGGTRYDLQTFTFDSVKIGYDQLPAMKLIVADVDLGAVPINLGLDFCHNRKVWISYRNNWLFVSHGPATLAYPVLAPQPVKAEADAKNSDKTTAPKNASE
jgi:hypothetical protein